MSEGEFSVWMFFEDDTHGPDVRHVDARTAVERARALTQSVGARIGVLKRVIITDDGDHTNFEWRFGEGITFPPR